MDKPELPTAAEIDELLAYLPKFERGDAIYGDPPWIQNPGQMPYPVYSSLVNDFYQAAGKPCWSDYGYQPAEAIMMLEDPLLIKNASLEQFKTMLTYCVRAERFGDGFWGTAIEKGWITALLRRLEVLRGELS